MIISIIIMIDFRFSPVENINNKQRVLSAPRRIKLKLKRFLFTNIKSLNTNDIILKRNFVR